MIQPADHSEQVISHLKQEIEHLNTLLLSKDSHIDSLKQAMLLLENHQAKLTESPAPWWKFWKKSDPVMLKFSSPVIPGSS